MPYPSSSGRPTPLKKCAIDTSNGAPPETAYSTLPPNTSMMVEYTSLLYTACLMFNAAGMPSPDCWALDHSRATTAASAKMRPLSPRPAFCEAAL